MSICTLEVRKSFTFRQLLEGSTSGQQASVNVSRLTLPMSPTTHLSEVGGWHRGQGES